MTTPCFKQVYRLYSNESGEAFADVVTLHDEVIDDTKPFEIFDPDHTWKRKTVTDFTAKPLLKQIFDKGRCVYDLPDVKEVRQYCQSQLETIWDEVKRFENPHKYYVDLSEKLWNIKTELIKEHSDNR